MTTRTRKVSTTTSGKPKKIPLELPQLAGLLHLALSTVAIPSTVLRGFPRLQKLHLDRWMLPTDSEGADGLGDIGGPHRSTAKELQRCSMRCSS
jgi:hypothetical protein